jgi:hypothetical protein
MGAQQRKVEQAEDVIPRCNEKHMTTEENWILGQYVSTFAGALLCFHRRRTMTPAQHPYCYKVKYDNLSACITHLG